MQSHTTEPGLEEKEELELRQEGEPAFFPISTDEVFLSGGLEIVGLKLRLNEKLLQAGKEGVPIGKDHILSNINQLRRLPLLNEEAAQTLVVLEEAALLSKDILNREKAQETYIKLNQLRAELSDIHAILAQRKEELAKALKKEGVDGIPMETDEILMRLDRLRKLSKRTKRDREALKKYEPLEELMRDIEDLEKNHRLIEAEIRLRVELDSLSPEFDRLQTKLINALEEEGEAGFSLTIEKLSTAIARLELAQELTKRERRILELFTSIQALYKRVKELESKSIEINTNIQAIEMDRATALEHRVEAKRRTEEESRLEENLIALNLMKEKLASDLTDEEIEIDDVLIEVTRLRALQKPVKDDKEALERFEAIHELLDRINQSEKELVQEGDRQLSQAIKSNDYGIVCSLLYLRAKYRLGLLTDKEEDEKIIFEAIKLPDNKILNRLIEAGFNLPLKNKIEQPIAEQIELECLFSIEIKGKEDGERQLRAAVKKNDYATVDALLKAGIHPDAGLKNNTPLFDSIERSKDDLIFGRLVQAGADIFVKEWGCTIAEKIGIACTWPTEMKRKALQYLSKKQLSLPAILQAACLGDEAILTTEIARNQLSVTDNNENTALHYAAVNGHISLCEKIRLAAPLLMKVANKDGQTAMLLSAQMGCLTSIQWLVSNGASVTEADTGLYKQTPLILAASGGHVSVLEWLYSKGAVNVTEADTGLYKQTPLILAASGGHVSVLEWLYSKGAVNVTEADGYHKRTPLMYAAEGGHLSVLEWLYAHGAVKVDAKDKDGKTAIDLAKTEDIKAFLRNPIIKKSPLLISSFSSSSAFFPAAAAAAPVPDKEEKLKMATP